MQILINSQGNGRCIYGEAIDLRAMGEVHVQRGSHVEPDESGAWWADLSPVDGPKLGPFSTRSVALEAEVKWLEAFWLTPPAEGDL
jgi:hypothetical protein